MVRNTRVQNINFNPHAQVTTDINVFAHICCDIVIISNCLEAILRAVIGPLPFLVIFGFNQVYKIFVILGTGVLNVSACLQVAIITNQRYKEL